MNTFTESSEAVVNDSCAQWWLEALGQGFKRSAICNRRTSIPATSTVTVKLHQSTMSSLLPNILTVSVMTKYTVSLTLLPNRQKGQWG
jgi:hypothetical protein